MKLHYYNAKFVRILGHHKNIVNTNNIWGDCGNIRGNAQNLTGDVTGLHGDISGLSGNATLYYIRFTTRGSILFGDFTAPAPSSIGNVPVAEVL